MIDLGNWLDEVSRFSTPLLRAGGADDAHRVDD
jgi:hypothetical protein